MVVGKEFTESKYLSETAFKMVRGTEREVSNTGKSQPRVNFLTISIFF